ncbi:unnamed protein product [Protopolystoma xenopodis]|uniref:Uncharacterized protein n=1 Tax=Protopolystoma xenopodis TaxID=117903 RepID=A0A448XJN4_9PLAT|nr:unnamed protein product [Protopolystoma xenopodis]
MPGQSVGELVRQYSLPCPGSVCSRLGRLQKQQLSNSAKTGPSSSSPTPRSLTLSFAEPVSVAISACWKICSITFSYTHKPQPLDYAPGDLLILPLLAVPPDSPHLPSSRQPTFRSSSQPDSASLNQCTLRPRLTPTRQHPPFPSSTSRQKDS